MCRNAGIRVIMITGDNGVTASSVARRIGIDGGKVVTGDEMEQMTDEELGKAAAETSVFSRVFRNIKCVSLKRFRKMGRRWL